MKKLFFLLIVLFLACNTEEHHSELYNLKQDSLIYYESKLIEWGFMQYNCFMPYFNDTCYQDGVQFSEFILEDLRDLIQLMDIQDSITKYENELKKIQ